MEHDPQLLADLTTRALAQAFGPTLEDVRRVVAGAEGLAPSRRRDLGSALAILARATGRPLSALPGEKCRLAAFVRELDHAKLGISKKRLSNLRSDIWAAVSIAKDGGALPPRPALAPSWQSLHARLPTKRLQIGLSRMMRYHSALGIDPVSVSDATLAAYRTHLESHTYRNARDLHRVACKLWNTARRTVSDWPQVPLVEPYYITATESIAWEQFPAAFVSEIEQFLHWAAGRDFITRDPPTHVCAPTTITLKRKQLRLFASAAVRGGYAIENMTSLAALISEPCLQASVQHYTNRPDRPSDEYIFNLLRTLTAMARGWLNADPDQLGRLRRLKRYLRPRTFGLTPKNRECLRQFESPDNLKRLRDLPLRLVEPKRLAKLNPERQAIMVCTALAIEILIIAPMRIGNLVSLRLDHHIHRPSARRQHVHIVLNEGEVKNRVPLEFPLTKTAVKLLDLYLKHHHAVLAPSGSPFLFPAPRSGTRRHTDSFAKRIQDTIRDETPLRMTCHQFRHFAAWLYLTRHPGQYEIVRRLLGHKSIQTTINFYAGFETAAAVRHFHATILELSGEPETTPPTGPRTRRSRPR